jgi:hypothetical protein
MPIATVLSREQRRIDAPQVQVEVDRNRHHKLDQQLCRWLLLSFLQGSDLLMTHELIANMLGVRREGVTEIAHKLQSAGLINYPARLCAAAARAPGSPANVSSKRHPFVMKAAQSGYA